MTVPIGSRAVLYARTHGLRVVVAEGILLDPHDEAELKEITRLIQEGHGARITVEDPTKRKELS